MKKLVLFGLVICLLVPGCSGDSGDAGPEDGDAGWDSDGDAGDYSDESGVGDGAGDGAGDGTGDGAGDGTGDGAGDGTGDGAGDGTGDGAGDGAEDGGGDGIGDGDGGGGEVDCRFDPQHSAESREYVGQVAEGVAALPGRDTGPGHHEGDVNAVFVEVLLAEETVTSHRETVVAGEYDDGVPVTTYNS